MTASGSQEDLEDSVKRMEFAEQKRNRKNKIAFQTCQRSTAVPDSAEKLAPVCPNDFLRKFHIKSGEEKKRSSLSPHLSDYYFCSDTVEALEAQKNGKSFYAGHKRPNYITWEDYFMGIALLAAERSKDPRTQVGAVIVNDENVLVGVGYNGMPRVCHAEMNAFMNANPKVTKGCKLYVTLFPCNECAKIIIQSGIKEVIYKSERLDEKTLAAKRMFDAVNINYRPFKSTRKSIILYLGGGSDSFETASAPKKERGNNA